MPLLRLLARIWTVLLGLTTLALFFGLMARFLLPLAPWTEAPGLPVIMPSDSSAEVLPRSEISLRFNTPMNRRTTGAALRIEPPTPGSYRWSDDAQTLTFTPAGTLAPAATYTVTLETTALDRWWRPLPVPVQSIFRTAPLPAVVSALPNDLAALPQNTLAVVFSQAMVAAEQVGRDIEVPQLQFTPSVDVDMQWIDQRTLILLPDTPLQSATRYTVTIAPDLSDLRGVDLGTPFSWSFATAWPSVSERNPPSGERWAGPRQALSFYLSAPLDRELLRRSLQISPAVIGRVDVTPAGAGQLVTFTPTNGWTPGSSYSVTFQTPDDLAIGAPPDLRWRFTVEPEPGLVAFFPGQSQLLPPDQAVRLVFSTPMEEEALRAGLRIEPPVADPAITVSGTEVRLRPDLEPSTNYTITIAAGTLDRTGEPLADPVIVRLRTAAADPFLAAPDALANLITLPISQSAVVDLERVNLSRLDLSLYKLDSPTLLRAFGFSADEWREFNPERYGQSLARRWQADLDDPDDSAISSGLPIGLNDGGLLDPGAYYLRVLSREGPRLDLIVLVSDLRITLRHSDNQALVWATDTRSGAPVAGVPVAIYAGDALITRGITGDDGIWEQPIRRNPQDPPYLVVAEGPQPAIADARWSRSQPAEPRHRALLLSDELSYRAGELVQVRGQVRRRATGGDLILPAGGTTCRLQLTADRGPAPAAPLSSACRINSNGDLSAELRLSTVIEPGNYAIRIQIADVTTVLPLRVTNPDDATRLTIARNNAALNLRAEANGSALADVEVDWSLRLEPVAIPAELHEFSFNPQPEPQVLSGSARTNAEGRLEIPLPQADPPGLRYRFSAEINTLDGRNASADAIGLLAPTAVTLGLHLPQRIVLTDERATVELASIATTGEAERGQSITIEVFPSAASDGAPLLVRRTISDSRGRAAVQLVPLRPGAYIVRAEASDATTETTLYVAGNAYAGWTNAPGEVAIITDRTVYQPGDVARLLVTSPFTTATLLLTQERDDLRDYAVLPLQAGRLITLTVTPDMAPAISLGALLAGDELRVGATELRVGTETPVLTLTVAADRPTYLPEATAALTVTINDDQGPAAADLLLSISPDDGLADAVDPARRAFAPPAPAGLSVALPGAPLAPLSPPVPPAVIPGALVPLRAGAGALGTFTARVELPDQPGRWRISAYAFDNGGLIALDTTVITTELPLEVEPFAAPVIRPDDRAGAGLILRSTSATTSTVRIDVIADQALIDRRTLLNRTVVLAPGAEQRLTWMISDAEGPQATLRIQVAAGDYRTERSLSILVAGAADPVAFAERTASDVAGLRLSEWISAGAELEIQIAPNLRAALADSISAERSENRITDRAAHLLIATQLGSSGDTAVRERWRLEALQAWNELTAGQNSDGGWGWWPGSPSSPFISAFAVEAQAAGGRFLGSERSTSLRALAYLERVAPQAEPNLRAYIAYVLRQAGRPSNDLLFELPIDELNRAGLAFAALSLSDAEAETALDRLLALVDRASADTPPLAGLPRDQLSSAAATVQALQARRPGTPALELNRERIRASWGVAGWSSAYAAARVAMALQPVSVPTPPPIQQITLGDQIIAAGPVTTTLRFTIPAAAANTLNIATPPNSEPLIAVRTPETPPEDSTPLLVDLIAANGETLDPARLRNGDSLTMSLLLIVTEPILGAELEIALPAAFELLPTSVPTPFDHLGERRDQRIVRLTAATLMPGVYRVQLPLHIISFGRFNAPPPRLQSQYDNKRPQYARQPLVIRVQP